MKLLPSSLIDLDAALVDHLRRAGRYRQADVAERARLVLDGLAQGRQAVDGLREVAGRDRGPAWRAKMLLVDQLDRRCPGTTGTGSSCRRRAVPSTGRGSRCP